MPGPFVTLTVFAALLALFGLLAHWRGCDSRDGFTDQTHRPQR